MIPEYVKEKPDYMKSRRELETGRYDMWKSQEDKELDRAFELACLMVMCEYANRY